MLIIKLFLLLGVAIAVRSDEADASEPDSKITVNGLQLATLTAQQVASDLGQKLENEQKLRFSNLTDNDLLSWVPPTYLKQNVLYYQSGVDDEGRPVWIVEAGRFPIDTIAEADEKALQAMYKYFNQMLLRIIKSVEFQNSTEVNDVFIIFDVEHFPLSAITRPKNIRLMFNIISTYKNQLIKYGGKMIMVNTNFVAETAFHLIRPLLGRAVKKAEIYGTNKEKWMNALRRALPPEAIPTWYGGPPEFKPIQVYGR